MTVSTIGNGVPFFEPESQFAVVGKKELDREDFMKLFITQLQHQDPLEPLESYEMASQLAQFSSMEATLKVSDNLEKLLDFQRSQNNLQLLSLIDRDITAFGNRIAVENGSASATEFRIERETDFCIVEIYNEEGRLVTAKNLGKLLPGAHHVGWDGKDDSGTTVADGVYTYRVDALAPTGEQLTVEHYTGGRVSAVEFANGKATVTVAGHIELGVGDILTVE